MDYGFDPKSLTYEQVQELKRQLPKKPKYVPKNVYRRKENPTRFFLPSEWKMFISSVHPKTRFFYWFLFYTGMRYKEAKNVKVMDVDMKQSWIIIKKPKGIGAGKPMRYAHLSSKGRKLIADYIKEKNLQDQDLFGFPTIQALIKQMQGKMKKLKVRDWRDFSVHNIRKTHENYLNTLQFDESKITRHMGHNQSTAMKHYLSGAFIKDRSDIEWIRRWLGDIFGDNR